MDSLARKNVCKEVVFLGILEEDNGALLPLAASSLVGEAFRTIWDVLKIRNLQCKIEFEVLSKARNMSGFTLLEELKKLHLDTLAIEDITYRYDRWYSKI